MEHIFAINVSMSKKTTEVQIERLMLFNHFIEIAYLLHYDEVGVS